MTNDEFMEKWLAYEMYWFIIDYIVVYGEEYVKKNDVWLRREFLNKWKRMSEEEKQKRCEAFAKALKEDKHDRT